MENIDKSIPVALTVEEIVLVMIELIVTIVNNNVLYISRLTNIFDILSTKE
jgi:hypothetical protein